MARIGGDLPINGFGYSLFSNKANNTGNAQDIQLFGSQSTGKNGATTLNSKFANEVGDILLKKFKMWSTPEYKEFYQKACQIMLENGYGSGLINNSFLRDGEGYTVNQLALYNPEIRKAWEDAQAQAKKELGLPDDAFEIKGSKEYEETMDNIKKWGLSQA